MIRRLLVSGVVTVNGEGASMAAQNIYVDRYDRATLQCPQCGFSRTGKVTEFGNPKKPLKVRCPCHFVFKVSFERRRVDRKAAHFDGCYGKLPVYEDWGRMVVTNISPMGIGFTALTTHNLRVGDELRTTFAAPTMTGADIDRNGVVRVVRDKYVGCEFRNFLEG